MSQDITTAGPAPAWLCEPLLQPGERVLLWGGPRDGGFRGWLRGRVGRLIVKDQAPFLLLAGIAAPFLFAFAGKGLFLLLGWASGPGYVLGAVLGGGCFIATLEVLNRAGEDVFHVLTDRRFLVIKGYALVQAFEFDLMRRLLAAVDAAPPASVPTDEHVQEPGKVRPAGGVIEVEPIQRMLRAAAPPGAFLVWNASSAPSWLGEPLLQPGERVVLWGGPRFGRLLGWLRRGVAHLTVKGNLGLLLLVGIVAVPGFPLAGTGLDRLLGWTDVGPGFICGMLLALGYVFGTIGVLVCAEKDVYYALTDLRLLVIRNYQLVQAFDLDHMRRLLAAVDAAPPAGAPADEHVQEPSKVHPAEGVTEMGPILRMLRTFGQVQAPVSK